MSAPTPAQDTWKRAQNLQVATLDEGALLGKLEDFQFDLEDARIYGWRIRSSGVFSKVGGVASQDFLLLGRDLAFIRAEVAVEQAAGKAAQVDGRAWARSYVGLPAMTRRGQAMGEVEDFVLDRKGQKVLGLLLTGGRLAPLEGKVSTGPAAVIIEEATVLLEMGEGDKGGDWFSRLRSTFSGEESGESS